MYIFDVKSLHSTEQVFVNHGRERVRDPYVLLFLSNPATDAPKIYGRGNFRRK